MACKATDDQNIIELSGPESLTLLGHQENVQWYWILRKSQWKNHMGGMQLFYKVKNVLRMITEYHPCYHKRFLLHYSLKYFKFCEQVRSDCQSPVTFTHKDWMIRNREAVECGWPIAPPGQPLCLHGPQ